MILSPLLYNQSSSTSDSPIKFPDRSITADQIAAANQLFEFNRFNPMSNQLPLHLIHHLPQQPQQQQQQQQPQQQTGNDHISNLFGTDSSLTLELAKVQILLAAISQNTQTPVFALIPNTITNNSTAIQEPLTVDTSAPPHPSPLSDNLPPTTVSTEGNPAHTSPQNGMLPSKILHELLTGSDVSHVRNRSNLLEPSFIPSDGGSTMMEDSSDTSSVTHPIKLEPPSSSDDVCSTTQTQQQSLLVDRLLDLLKAQTINPPVPSVFDAVSHRQRKSDTSHQRSYPTPIKNHHPENRPRSYSDLHHINRHKLKRPHADEADKLTQELESSLFAQLVLTPESSPSPTSSSSRINPTISCQLKANQSNRTDHHREPSVSRKRLFEWLREADLFVAEHCRDIPLGTLLSVAITPEQNNVTELLRTLCKAPSADPLPRSAKQTLEKCWHHLLLISLMEHQFYPQPPNEQVGKINESRRFDRDKNLVNSVQDGKLEELRRLLGSLSTSNGDEEDGVPISHSQLHTELTDLIQTTSNLKLNAAVFDSMRFSILAQNAYPNHFSTTYKEALSSLENGLSHPPADRSTIMIDILKLLNRLHCFDANHLRKFLSLTSDPPEPDDQSSSLSPSTSKLLMSDDSVISTFSKRRAHLTLPLVTSSPVGLRTRAYTTSACSKSARLCYPHSEFTADDNR